ncbi:MAG: hypothetical protein V2A54_02315, partial [Bacteroidota bacterium]
LFLLLIFISSCSGKRYTLNEKDKLWNPYLGNEILIFQSNLGKIDTLLLKGLYQEMNQLQIYSLNPDYFETISIYCNNYNPKSNILDENDKFIQVFAKNPIDGYKSSAFRIRLKTKKIQFTFQDHYIKDLDTIKKTKLLTTTRFYDDITIIKMPPISESFIEDSKNQTIFWSRKDGLVKFTLNDGSSWELIKKYSK